MKMTVQRGRVGGKHRIIIKEHRLFRPHRNISDDKLTIINMGVLCKKIVSKNWRDLFVSKQLQCCPAFCQYHRSVRRRFLFLSNEFPDNVQLFDPVFFVFRGRSRCLFYAGRSVVSFYAG